MPAKPVQTISRRPVAGKAARWFACLALLAAVALAAPPRDLRRAQIRAWTTVDGLPEEYISGIAESEDGYLWLATRDGLVRFDGHNFRSIRPGEQIGIHDAGTGAVFASHGKLWVGGRDYLAVAQPDRFGSFTKLDFHVVPFRRPRTERFGVASMQIQPGGTALLHRTDGVYRWDGAGPPVLHLKPPAGEMIHAFTAGPSGRLWIMTESGLKVRQGDTWHRVARSPTHRASLLEARDGTLWILSDQGLFRATRDRNTWTVARIPLRAMPSMASFQGLLEDASGAIWVGIPGGVARLAGGRTEEYPLTDLLRPDDALQSLYQTRDGAIWGGSRWGTLVRMEARLFNFFDQQDGLRDSAISAVAEDGAGRMWIGSRIGGAAAAEGNGWRPVPGSATGVLGAMTRLGDGRMLGTTTEGLWVGDARGVRTVWRPGRSPAPGSFRSLSPDYGTHLYFNDDTQIYRLKLPVGERAEAEPVAPVPAVRGILEIGGEVWAASWDQGLAVYEHGRVTTYPLDTDGERHAMTLYALTPDLLLVGTNTGIFAFDRRRRAYVGRRPVFSRDHIFFIQPDTHGNLWLLGRQALLTAPRQALADYFAGRRPTVLPYRLTAHQGLRSTNFGLGTSSAATQASNGEVWLASLAGAMSFPPEALVSSSENVRCAVDEVLADGVQEPMDSTLDLPAGTRRVQLQYTVLDRKAGQNPIFRYRLVGDRGGWVETSQFQAVFTNLPAGRYEFELQARVASLEWPASVARLPFTVEPHWYERESVQWMELAGLALLLWGWSRYRANRVRRQTMLLEARVRARTEELALARDEAERARLRSETDARVKSDFLANMSHEIRTPLNGVIGMTELALETELTPVQREYIDLAKLSADSLLTVINDVLDFSKIEAGKFTLDPRPFAVSELVERTVAILGLSARKKGIALTCALSAEIPPVLTGDAGRLRQVLLNLAGNAVKFTERGGVSVSVELDDLGEPPAGGAGAVQLRFAIADTGIGIPASEHHRIFHAFEQADGSTTRRHGGTGLGLTISTRLVQMMGGNIWLESEPGRGSTFWFTVRLEAAPASLARQLSRLAAAVQPVRALIVDPDEERGRRLAAQAAALELEGVPLSDPTLAGEAIATAAAAGRPFALVLFAGESLPAGYADSGLPYVLLGEPAVLPASLEGLLAAGADAEEPLPEAPAEGPRLLLAEDNLVNQRVAVRMLESRGYRVTVVDNGRKALEEWERAPYDLLLFDVQMPEMDGLEAAAEIRRREAGRRRIPIMALTAGAFKEDRERCLNAGMDDYVTKPIQSRELFERLERMLSVSARAATS